jgi:hypothetical protein
VPKSRSTRAYRQPSREEESKILFLGFQLGELFEEKEIEDFMAAAKRRIVGEFHYAMETNPRFRPGSDRRPKRRTDNYIVGLGCKPSELARYVNQTMHRPFVKANQLPSEFQDLRPKLVETLLLNAQYEALLMTIQVMHGQTREIWYDEAVGIWQIIQSSVDEWVEYQRVARSARVKADMRPFHGRVRSQSRRSGTPAGTSVSLA